VVLAVGGSRDPVAEAVRNSDLTKTNWTGAPTPSTLNFTNLNYQVTVSPTNGQSFYRLKQE
jgi:hypothetical protein